MCQLLVFFLKAHSLWLSRFSSEEYADLRYSSDLCDEEKEFREKRKVLVFEAMKRLLGEQGPQNMDEVGEKVIKN